MEHVIQPRNFIDTSQWWARDEEGVTRFKTIFILTDPLDLATGTPHALSVWSAANGTCHSSPSSLSPSSSSTHYSSARPQNKTAPKSINYYLRDHTPSQYRTVESGVESRSRLPPKCQFINGPCTRHRGMMCDKRLQMSGPQNGQHCDHRGAVLH